MNLGNQSDASKTPVGKGRKKAVGRNVDNTKALILRCSSNCENRSENYCEDHDCISCYKCASSGHNQCTVISIDEAAVRQCDDASLNLKYNELIRIQNEVLDTTQALDNEIENHSESDSDSGPDFAEKQLDKPLADKYVLGLRPPSENKGTIKRVHVLCRELEDIVSVTLQSFKCSVSRKGDVVAFVAFMKNRHRLTSLKNELCNIHTDSAFENHKLKGQENHDNIFSKTERKLDQLTHSIEDFLQTLIKTFTSDHYISNRSYQDLSQGKDQESKHNTHNVIVDRTTTNFEENLIVSIGEEELSTPMKLDHDIKQDFSVKVANNHLRVLEQNKVIRNSTKSGHGKRHRVIRYSDTEKYLIDDHSECENNFVHMQSTTPSFEKEVQKEDRTDSAEIKVSNKPTDTMAEVTPTMNVEVNKEMTQLLIENDTENEDEELPVYIPEMETPPPTENTFLRESAILFDVFTDGSRVTSSLQSERRPYSREIVLSTNRIKTKTCSPPGFHGQSVQVQHKLRLISVGELCIRLPSDSYPCSINGITCMPDGKVVVSDFNNCCLKIFSSHGRNISHLPTKFPPFSVVCISNSLLMFAYGLARNIIGLVSVTSGLEIRQEFTTEHTCVALASNNSFIYVLCKNEYKTEVHILNTEGVVNMKIDLGVHIPSPQFITVDPLSERIYITDCKGVFGIERTGSKMTFLQDAPISRYTGLAADSCGNLFICTEFPDGVYAKPHDRNYLKPLLLGQNAHKVHAVCFNEINNSLIMSFLDSDYIGQYKIMSD